MSQTSTPPENDPRIQRLLDSFAVDPTDTPAFRTLEEELFLSESFSHLAGVYECRLAALEAETPQHTEVLMRLATTLDERLDDAAAARERYVSLLRTQPTHRDALRSLRRLLTRTGERTAALQIAEMEEALELPPNERAVLLAEVGELWRSVGESDEARERFRASLALDPACDAALSAAAALAEADGDRSEAIALHERRLASMVGQGRTDAQLRLVSLLGESENERKRTLLREIVRARPDEASALEHLLAIERAAGAIERVDELQRKLWKTLDSEEARLALSLEAATQQLDEGGDADGALYWAALAEQTAPSDATVQRLRTRIFRRSGQTAGVIDALSKLVDIDGPSPMRLLELAVLNERDGDPERAIGWLQRALDRDPDDDESLSVLDRCLARMGRHGERADVLERRASAAEGPREAAELWSELGSVCADDVGDAARAERAFRLALEHADDPQPASDRLCDLLRKNDRWDALAELLAELANGLPAGPAKARRWVELGRVHLDQRDAHEAARDAFRWALDLCPDDAEALAGLRAASAGDAASLIDACERELRGDPGLERTCELWAEIAGAARDAGDLPGARRAADRWAELSDSPDALGCAANIAHELGDVAGERSALGRLDALLGDDPTRAAAVLVRLGELELGQPEPEALDRAIDAFEPAAALCDDPGLRARLIDLYRRAGRTTDLVAALTAHLETLAADEQRPFRLELARALDELGDAVGATNVLTPAFDAHPDDDEIGDVLEALLWRQERLDEMCDVLGRRLARVREPAQRRELAQRLATLLIDDLGRPGDAVAVLREHADPTRTDPLEQLYERALETGGPAAELQSWLKMREAHVDGGERISLLMRLAALHEADGDVGETVDALERALRIASGDDAEAVRGALLASLRRLGTPTERIGFLEQILDGDLEGVGRAAFLVERARLRFEHLDDATGARADLEAARAIATPSVGEHRLAATIAERSGEPRAEALALDALAEATDDALERRRSLLKLASLRLDGAPDVRDRTSGEAVLVRLLAMDGADAEAFDRLCALYTDDGRDIDLCALLAQRLEQPALRGVERASLALQLSRSHRHGGRGADAVRVLRDAIARGHAPTSVYEELFSALELAGDLDGRIALCAESSAADGENRERWMRRWLFALEEAGAATSEHLAAIDQYAASGGDAILCDQLRVPLLRDTEDVRALGRALEGASRAADLSPGRRRLYTRERLVLYEGPIGDPEGALRLIESELDFDPNLRARGAAIARSLGQHEREATLLEPIAAANDAPTAAVRRYGLACNAFGQGERAEPFLWRALQSDARDREVLAALGERVRERNDFAGLLRLHEARFALESREDRKKIAREAREACAGEATTELRWIRREQALGGLSTTDAARWLELERECGTLAGSLAAVRAIRDKVQGREERATLQAAEAAIHFERGHLELARQGFEAALELADAPGPASWWQTLDMVLDRLGQAPARVDVLRQLASHPDLDVSARNAAQGARIELLASRPELREEAALELRMLVDSDTGARRGLQAERMRKLLGLLRELGRAPEWCELAERLCPLLPDVERAELERELARTLTEPLWAGERAATAWERILDREPADSEALLALARVLDRPGAEARRAPILERCAELPDTDRATLLCEAAALRWRSLGDAAAAFVCVQRALELDNANSDAHELRAELCAELDRPDDEVDSLQTLLARDADGKEAADRWLRLAQLASTSPDKMELAEDAAGEALQRHPGNAAARREVRRIFERTGDWRRAADLIREEIALVEGGESILALRRLIRVLWDEMRDAPAACEALEALAEVESMRAEDWSRWADALREREDWAGYASKRAAALEAFGANARADDWLELAHLANEQLTDRSHAEAAANAALGVDPDHIDALALRATLAAERSDAEAELGDRVRLGELRREDVAAAADLARAAELARDVLDDPMQAARLFRRALARDGAQQGALLGAGDLAFEAGEWAEAEQFLGLAVTLLAGSADSGPLAAVARRAAQAALEQDRGAEAYRYLETALDEDPDHPEALEAMAGLSLRLGAYDAARQSLETLLARPCDDATRAGWLAKLAQASEGLGDLELAADTLCETVRLNPDDEVARARAVDLCERLGDSSRAVKLLDGWAESAPPSFAAQLRLRAAQLELGDGEREQARVRLTALVDTPAPPAAAWQLLADTLLEAEQWSAALETTERGLDAVEASADRGALLWCASRAYAELERMSEAAFTAAETLGHDPGNVDAALLVARHLGHIEDWAMAVHRIERTLDVAHPPPAVESELWEAVGRAYSGPLEDLEHAQRCYRRALESNPMRATAREALADTTAFDPAVHGESIRLHRDLLEDFAGRPGTWRSLACIAEHWKRDPAVVTCHAVLRALGLESGETPTARELRIDADPSSNPAVRGAIDLLGALEESDLLPEGDADDDAIAVPARLSGDVESLAGRAWRLPDTTLRELWSQPIDEIESALSRRARRRLKRAAKQLAPDAFAELEPELWREEILAHAAARALTSGRAELRTVLVELIAAWPATRHLDLSAGGELAAVIQMCPPARGLLLRIADATLDGIGI